MKPLATIIAAMLLVLTAAAQQSHSHADAVDRRGDHAMGFDHEKTAHHFLLKSDGGIIRVEANDASDDASRDSIRMHLSHVAKAFAAGDFDLPMFIHDRVPPGVPVMKRKKAQIAYQYREIPAGAEVVITSADRKAVAAIHDFLRFQIEDHRTGDSTTVQ
jgi:hypothetical protein